MEMILKSSAIEVPESDVRTQYSEALRRGIEKHGIPSEIMVDNGTGYELFLDSKTPKKSPNM